MPNAKVLSEKQAIVAALTEKLQENMDALVGAIVKAKPAAAKGQYIKSCVAASTMGPGVKMNANKQL